MKCKKCGVTKPSAFYPSIGAYCREHWKQYVRRNRKKNAAHYLAYDKARAMRPDRVAARAAYQKTPNGKLSRKRTNAKWLRRNLFKRAAHIMTGNAIRDGRLVKKPCEICGAVKVEAHHDDYGKPFDVRWLCRKHHLEHHNGIA